METHEFKDFFETTQRPLLAYLRRVSGDEALAEDLLQETFLRLLEHPPYSKECHSKRVYVFTIATRLLKDHWRNHTKRRWFPWPWRGEDDEGGGGLPEPASEGLDLIKHLEDTQRIARGFQKLAHRQRQMLWLAYVEGWDHGELATAFSLSKASVRVMLHRARMRMIEAIQSSDLETTPGVSS